MISIIVPTYNRKLITVPFVKQLYAQTYKSWELVVCDSSSLDGTVEELKKFDRVHVLDVGADNWWSGAVNAGMSFVLANNYNCVIIMNDDLVLETDFLERIVANVRSYPKALHTVKQFSLSGLEYYGLLYKGPFLKTFSLEAQSVQPKLTRIDCGNGCCIASTPETFCRLFPINSFLIPHLSGDVSIYLKARNQKIPIYVDPRIVLRQNDSTNYFDKYTILNILFAKGSPLNLFSYLTVGILRFGSMPRFFAFGFLYHYGYLKSLVKFIYFKTLS